MLAKAVEQAQLYWMFRRFREQARFHRDVCSTPSSLNIQASLLAMRPVLPNTLNWRQPPIDRRLAMLLEKLIGPAEMPATNETSVGRQR